MNFETSKTLGGIGALLLFVGIIPFLNYLGVVSLIGAILLLIGLKGLADYYHEAGIFNNALYGIIAGIVGVVVFVAIIVSAAVGFITTILPGWAGDLTSLSQINPSDLTGIDLSTIGPFVAAILIAFVVLFVLVLVVALLYRKSLTLLKDKTGVGLFGTAGTVLLIGAVLTIIVIGLLLVWISVLLIAIAFFQIRPQPPPPPQTATPAQYPTQV